MSEPVVNWLSGQVVPGYSEAVRTPKWDYHMEWFNLYPLVSDVFGRAWRGEPEGQGTYITVDVSPQGPEFDDAEEAGEDLARWLAMSPPADLVDQWRIDLWWERQSDPPSTDVMLWQLCQRGIIPAGRYIITTWW